MEHECEDSQLSSLEAATLVGCGLRFSSVIGDVDVLVISNDLDFLVGCNDLFCFIFFPEFPCGRKGGNPCITSSSRKSSRSGDRLHES